MHGIPANRIVLGGFSQGCVLALLTGLTAEYRFAGLVALSGYMPMHTKIMNMVSDASKKTPIFWGHGDADQVCTGSFISFNIHPFCTGSRIIYVRLFNMLLHAFSFPSRWCGTNMESSPWSCLRNTSTAFTSRRITTWPIALAHRSSAIFSSSSRKPFQPKCTLSRKYRHE